MLESEKNLSDEAMKELKEVWTILSKQAEHVISALDSTDKKDVNMAQKEEQQINQLVDKLEENHIARLGSGKCDAVTGIIFMEILSELEKIGDHFANIADRAKKIQKHHLELK
jgi:phosphate:Na+ symporter